MSRLKIWMEKWSMKNHEDLPSDSYPQVTPVQQHRPSHDTRFSNMSLDFDFISSVDLPDGRTPESGGTTRVQSLARSVSLNADDRVRDFKIPHFPKETRLNILLAGALR